MTTHHYQPEEIDRLIPTFELIFGRVYAKLADLVDLRRTIEAADLPLLPEELAAVEIPPELNDPVKSYLGAITEVALELRKIAILGGLLKDLDLGLVDFPSFRDGQPVYLCWRYGEKVVGWYHDRNAGFQDRKPLAPGRVAMGAPRLN